MQHVGKLICSNLGARMDSEPKRWRILGLHLDCDIVLFPLLSLKLDVHGVSSVLFTIYEIVTFINV